MPHSTQRMKQHFDCRPFFWWISVRSWVIVFPTGRDPSEPPLNLGDLQLRHLGSGTSLLPSLDFGEWQSAGRGAIWPGAQDFGPDVSRSLRTCLDAELWPLCHSHKLVNLSFSWSPSRYRHFEQLHVAFHFARHFCSMVPRSPSLSGFNAGSEALLVVQLLAARRDRMGLPSGLGSGSKERIL